MIHKRKKKIKLVGCRFALHKIKINLEEVTKKVTFSILYEGCSFFRVFFKKLREQSQKRR